MHRSSRSIKNSEFLQRVIRKPTRRRIVSDLVVDVLVGEGKLREIHVSGMVIERVPPGGEVAAAHVHSEDVIFDPIVAEIRPEVGKFTGMKATFQRKKW